MLIVTFALLVLALPVAAVFIAARHGARITDATPLLTLLGSELLLVGYLLTPGLLWGQSEEHVALATLSTIVWLLGAALLVVAGLRWLRRRPTGPQP